jgi:hypothetical protein
MLTNNTLPITLQNEMLSQKFVHKIWLKLYGKKKMGREKMGEKKNLLLSPQN